MKIEQVHLTDLDDSLSLLSPSRCIEIRTDEGIFLTPNRMVTSYEFNRKKVLPTEITIENPASVYSKKFSAGDITRLITTNKEFTKQVTHIESSNNSTQYSTLQLCSFSVAMMASKGAQPYEILAREHNLNEFVSAIIDMQVEAGNDIISIPHLNLEFTQLCALLKDIDNTLERIDKQPIFNIDLRYPKFIELTNFITSEFEPLMIDLTYRKYRDVRQHYRHLKNFADKDIAFLLSGVERIDSGHFNLSTMHYMPFLGNDLYAVESPALNIPDKNAPVKPKNLANLKTFDSRDMTFSSLVGNSIPTTTLLDQLEGAENDLLLEKIENVNEARDDAKKYEIITALTRVHELKTSSDEFSKLQTHVKENSSKEYVKSKLKFEERLGTL